LADLILLLDIGTTTISADIIDPDGYRSLVSGFVLNAQSTAGEDIISRIDFAMQNRHNTLILQKKAAASINKLINRLIKDDAIKGRTIRKVVCACNSAIHHILLGIDTLSLITPPYRIQHRSEITVYAYKLGLNLGRDVKVTFLPNIGGFVGSDALCAILAAGIYRHKGLRIVIDMGTNSEIIVGNMYRILAASAAAGPAFETRYIKNGMPATRGAITKVRVKKGRVGLDVMGNTEPKGITGSGLIDACYQLYRDGFIDRSGRMRAEEFVLYKKGRKKIAITQSDIRKLQLAKGAILAGMKVLLRRYKSDSSDIEQVIFTGSFGAGLNAKSVIGIGLVPSINIKKIRYIRNAVLKGLRLWVKDKSIRDNILSMLDMIEHVPLFGKGFGKEFTESLQF
jgi:uncharacterized 2Fe-2S/4Fe-4S cluster protein (DUF4445 family)